MKEMIDAYGPTILGMAVTTLLVALLRLFLWDFLRDALALAVAMVL